MISAQIIMMREAISTMPLLVDYLRWFCWQRNKLLGILLFLFLQVAIDRVQVIIEFNCVAVAQLTRLFNDFVVPHKSITRQFLPRLPEGRVKNREVF